MLPDYCKIDENARWKKCPVDSASTTYNLGDISYLVCTKIEAGNTRPDLTYFTVVDTKQDIVVIDRKCYSTTTFHLNLYCRRMSIKQWFEYYNTLTQRFPECRTITELESKLRGLHL